MNVFDSSAIYKLVCLNRTSMLAAQYTSALAFYELGNVVGKNSVLTPLYSKTEAADILAACDIALDKMRVIQGDIARIYKIAAQCQISFYDAAYVSIAVDFKHPFITLDQKLAARASCIVQAVRFDEFVT